MPPLRTGQTEKRTLWPDPVRRTTKRPGEARQAPIGLDAAAPHAGEMPGRKTVTFETDSAASPERLGALRRGSKARWVGAPAPGHAGSAFDVPLPT